MERHVPGSYATVAAALNAAQPGDVVVVAAGSFPLATSRVGIQLTIRGAGMLDTVLDAGGASVVLGLTDSQVSLQHLTLRDGGDGINAVRSDVSLDSVRVELCSDGVDLGTGSSLSATDSEFVFNSDDGIDLDEDSALQCLFCTLSDNGDDGIEIRMHDFTGPALASEVAWSRIERNDEVGIQLIDGAQATARSFHFHDLVIANNALGGVTWQCCMDTVEDLDGYPGDEPVRIERATIVGNGGPGVEGGLVMEVSDSVLWQNAPDLHQVGGPLGINLVGTDPSFTSDFRLAQTSPAVGAASGGGELGAFPLRQCSDGVDNDGDGAVDLADTACADLDHPREVRLATWGCGLGPELVPLLGLLAVRRILRGPRRTSG